MSPRRGVRGTPICPIPRDPRLLCVPRGFALGNATAHQEVSMTKPLFAAAGLLERLLCRLAAGVLPWSQRSQHDAYLAGWRDGAEETAARLGADR